MFPTTNLRLAILLAAVALLSACTKTVSSPPVPPATVERQAGAPAERAASLSPVPSPSPLPAERIKVAATTQTQYYTVAGATADEIFAYMEAYGPVDDKGARGTGVALYKSKLIWDTNRDPRACAIASMTIQVDLQVVLPLVDNPGRLPATLQSNWKNFADGVAAHEQRHVDIYLRGADTMKQKMLALPPTLGCALLESAVNEVWNSQQALTDQEQERFHRDERARIEGTRAPLKSQIDANKSRLDSLSSQISGLDASLSTLSGQIDPLRRLLDSLKSQIQAVEDKYQGGAVPQGIFQQYETFKSQYNNLIPSYNTLIDQYNGKVTQRGALMAQADELRNQTNTLVDQYNWIR